MALLKALANFQQNILLNAQCIVPVQPNYTVSQKNVSPLDCYNFDIYEWILIFFDRNVTDKVSNQKMPPQITCATALHDKTGKHKNCIFDSNDVLVHSLNSTSCLIISLTHDSRLTLLYDSLNLAINVFS